MRKERWLKMKVPTRLRPWLRALIDRNLHGSTEEEVIIQLVEERLRQMVVDQYITKADETIRHIRNSTDRTGGDRG